jgi:hypothetical protein
MLQQVDGVFVLSVTQRQRPVRITLIILLFKASGVNCHLNRGMKADPIAWLSNVGTASDWHTSWLAFDPRT